MGDLRDKSTKEIQEGVTVAQRHEKERKFLQRTPWNALSKDRVGVKALKPFIGLLLYEHIRREFPALVKEPFVRRHSEKGTFLELLAKLQQNSASLLPE